MSCTIDIEALAAAMKRLDAFDATARLGAADPVRTPIVKNDFICSFCGKRNTDVNRLIAGPAGFICDECVLLSCKILDEDLGPAEKAVQRTIISAGNRVRALLASKYDIADGVKLHSNSPTDVLTDLLPVIADYLDKQDAEKVEAQLATLPVEKAELIGERVVVASDGREIDVRRDRLSVFPAWMWSWRDGDDTFMGPMSDGCAKPLDHEPTDAEVLADYEAWQNDSRMAALNPMQRQQLETVDASIETLVDCIAGSSLHEYPTVAEEVILELDERRERTRSALHSLVGSIIELSRLRP